LPATPENLALANQMLQKVVGGGGTELLPALQQATRHAGHRRRVTQPGADHRWLRVG
jgi:Mg-chelatase subunit ChlD